MSITACSLLALSMMWGVAIAQQKSAGGGDEAALKALEEKWADANLKGDAVALDAILGDRFIFTSSTGKVEGKAEMLSELRSGDVKYQVSKVDDIKVVVYGDAAVVSGRWTGRVLEKGKTIDATERYTGTYVRQSGQWRCVAAQSTAIK